VERLREENAELRKALAERERKLKRERIWLRIVAHPVRKGINLNPPRRMHAYAGK